MIKPGYDLKKQIFDSQGNSLYSADQHLYAWYKFDQDISSAGSLTDSSGNGRSLSPKVDPDDRPLAPASDSPGSSPGFPQSSTEFSNDLLINDNDTDFVLPHGFTFSAWVKFNTLGSTNQVLVMQTNDNNSHGEYSFQLRYTSVDRIYFYIGNASAATYKAAATNTSLLTAGQWHHIAATYDPDAAPASDRLQIYIDGVDAKGQNLANTSADVVPAAAANSRLTVGNFYTEHGSYDFQGSFSEIAVWSRSLSAAEVSGLYRLADESNVLTVSRRVFGGSKTRGSQVVTLGVEGDVNNSYTSDDPYLREGHTTFDRKHHTGMKLYPKSNTDDISLYDGKELGLFYDDTLSSKLTPSASFYFGNRRRTSVLSHRMERRDLGQSSLYEFDDGFVESVDPENPLEIIHTHPYDLFLPISMVDFSSEFAKDGVVEPLDIRSKIDRTAHSAPFYIRGPRGSLAEETPFRRNSLIKEGFNLTDTPTVPYLDALEYFGNVEILPVFHEDTMSTTPFADTSSTEELYFQKKAKEGTSVSSDMTAVLISEEGFSTDDMEEFEVYGSRGSDYVGGGTDSVAFGGLKK